MIEGYLYDIIVIVKIKVSFFAQSREIVGKSRIDFEIEEGEAVSGLIKRLQSQFPNLLEIQYKVAVNTEYLENDHELHNGDEVAIIPPVGGG